jgi:hypothetical protein
MRADFWWVQTGDTRVFPGAIGHMACSRARAALPALAEDGSDIVDPRDPDRTYVLLLWLFDAQLI